MYLPSALLIDYEGIRGIQNRSTKCVCKTVSKTASKTVSKTVSKAVSKAVNN